MSTYGCLSGVETTTCRQRAVSTSRQGGRGRDRTCDRSLVRRELSR
jgi:hypothetical protein